MAKTLQVPNIITLFLCICYNFFYICCIFPFTSAHGRAKPDPHAAAVISYPGHLTIDFPVLGHDKYTCLEPRQVVVLPFVTNHDD